MFIFICRSILDNLKQELRLEKQSFSLSMREKETILECKTIDIQTKENYLNDKLQKFQEDLREFEMRKSLIEPYIEKTESEFKAISTNKQKSDEILQEANEKFDKILLIENEMIKRESKLNSYENNLRSKEFKLSEEKKYVLIGAVKLRQLKQEEKSKQFRLRQQALELSQQSFELNKYIRQLKLNDPDFENKFYSQSPVKGITIDSPSSVVNNNSPLRILVPMDEESRLDAKKRMNQSYLKEIGDIYRSSTTLAVELSSDERLDSGYSYEESNNQDDDTVDKGFGMYDEYQSLNAINMNGLFNADNDTIAKLSSDEFKEVVNHPINSIVNQLNEISRDFESKLNTSSLRTGTKIAKDKDIYSNCIRSSIHNSKEDVLKKSEKMRDLVSKYS